MGNALASARRRVTGWFHQHQRGAGIGVTAMALALLAMAVVLGWAMFARGKPSTADLGSSSEPSASAVSSPSAGATPRSEPSATPVPTPGFEVPAGILPPDSRAVVALDGLRVRERPGLNATVVDTLPADTQVEVGGFGPTVADGFDWYQVVYDDHRAGYAAAGSGADHYLELLPPRCIAGEPDLAALVRMTGWEQLACFGDRSLTVTGTYGCPVCGLEIPGSFEPRWLAGPNLNYLAFPDPFTLHFGPEAGLDAPSNASILRVTGHFSDPASTTCVMVPQVKGEIQSTHLSQSCTAASSSLWMPTRSSEAIPISRTHLVLRRSFPRARLTSSE
jgi:hypothetical protein